MGEVVTTPWVYHSLGDVLISIIGGGTPSKSNTSYYQGSIPWMTVKDMNKFILEDTVDHISQEAVENSSTNIIAAGIPIVATRMSLGKVVVAEFDSAINQDLKALILPSEINRGYFVYWYRSKATEIEALGTGTTVKGIRLEVLRELQLPVISLAEQKIIAQKLDTLLAQVENTKARLAHTRETLKQFRQSVLAAAVSGKLTEEWRGDNEYTDVNQYFKAPTSWKTTTLEEEVEYVTSGSRGWAKFYSTSGSVFIRSQDINTDELAFNDVAYVSLPDGAEGRRTKVQLNDVLITITGANVTKCARVKEQLDDAYISQHVSLVRLSNTKHSAFVEMMLKAENAGRKQLKEMAYGGGKPGLNLQNIKDVKFSIPDDEERVLLLVKVEQLFAHADTIDKQVEAAQARVNNLTQSILAKAFRGELTEQWRRDNPELISGENSAAALLEKIRSERAIMDGKKIKARRKPKAKAETTA